MRWAEVVIPAIAATVVFGAFAIGLIRAVFRVLKPWRPQPRRGFEVKPIPGKTPGAEEKDIDHG